MAAMAELDVRKTDGGKQGGVDAADANANAQAANAPMVIVKAMVAHGGSPAEVAGVIAAHPGSKAEIMRFLVAEQPARPIVRAHYQVLRVAPRLSQLRPAPPPDSPVDRAG